MVIFQQFYGKKLEVLVLHAFLFINSKWHWQVKVRTIVPNWDYLNYSQVRMTQLFPIMTNAVAPKWDWHNCSLLRLAQLFPSEAGMIISKWDSHDCSQLRLAWLFPSEAGMIFVRRKRSLLFGISRYLFTSYKVNMAFLT